MKKKILVVDNHKVVLKFMTTLLEKEGHEVLTAEDGLSAL
ncbi:MAG: response regulator, partial [Desulfobacteraceae bacterium]|nr:response regulator [Desulfobacteraceae bacterium]